jgi:PAN domain
LAEAEQQRFEIRPSMEGRPLSPITFKLGVASVDECRQKCAESIGCNVFTFSKASNICYSYSAAELVPNASFDSGVRQSATLTVLPPKPEIEQSAQSPKPPPDPTGEGLATRARSFVTGIQTRWSDATSSGLGWLDTLYANDVDYYGTRLSRDSVLADKHRFAERWPERRYRIQTNSTKAQCSTSECVVTGNIEWEARSLRRSAITSGIASFSYVLVPSGGTFVISGENGGVIQGGSRSLQTPGGR